MEFIPTYLYVKRHSTTGLKYFGKTRKDPVKYLGSGKYWTSHIKSHGKHLVETVWTQIFTNKNDLIDFALKFSIDNNIVESDEWANLVVENGIDGCIYGTKLTIEHRNKIAISGSKRRHQEYTKRKISNSNPNIKLRDYVIPNCDIIIEQISLREFSKNFNLNCSSVKSAFSNGRPYKGFICLNF